MIFHTAADPIYYDRFYNDFRNSIIANYHDTKFSLRTVGNFNQTPVADFITNDSITLEEIEKQYSCDGRNAKGYYCMSRWISIPNENSHVCVSDIDVIAINTIDHELIEDKLEKHKAINLTRIKTKSGKEGGMMVFFLHRAICKEIRDYANHVLRKNDLNWATDVDIRNFIYNNYEVLNLLKMQEISKSKSAKIIDPWFVFSKINKFDNLKY